ncbi:MAG: imidazolonepropionase, partial [Desulfobacterales bacterium]
MNMNLMIIRAAALTTSRGSKALAGRDMDALEVIPDGALRIEEGTITAVGTTADVMASGPNDGFTIIDAAGKAVLPGFV